MRLTQVTRRTALISGVVLGIGIADSIAQDTAEMAGVSAANDAFLAALSSLDMRRMESVWAREPAATAIHPASKSVDAGWDAVKKGWEKTFDRFAALSITMKDPIVRTHQGVGWIVGIEEVDLKLKSGEGRKFSAFTTNIFVKRDGRWLMILHHASRVPK